jgi:hypothetical protein
MKCLFCNKEIIGNKKFCSNKGSGNCKDKYHNRRGRDLSQARLNYIGFRTQKDLDRYITDDEDNGDFYSPMSIQKCKWCGYVICECEDYIIE